MDRVGGARTVETRIVNRDRIYLFNIFNSNSLRTKDRSIIKFAKFSARLTSNY